MSPRVLVADDDVDNRSIAQKILEVAGYQVVLASNGLEVLEIASKQKVDLILLDLSMPKMSGWEAARRLRERPELNQIPIVAFTAHAMTGDSLRARASGCDDYISKPCVPQEMAEKVKRCLEQKAQPGAGGQ